MSRVYYLHEAPPESELYEEVTMPTVAEVTAEELEAYFNDSPMLQQTFGDFNTYESFMGEQADLYDSGELVKWWELDPDAVGEDQDLHNWLLGNPHIDQGFLDEMDAVDSPFTIYQQQNMSPAMTALYEKYGLPSIDEESGLYGSVQFEDGADYRWTGTGWVKYREAPENGLIGDVVNVGVPLFMTVATAGAINPIATGALGSVMGGALSSAVGSAFGTIATGGDIEFDSLLTSAILGGIGGFADAVADGALAGSALDEAVWSMSDMLGISPGEVIDILEGVATGAVSGGDLEDIVIGAVAGLGEAKVKDYLSDIFGDVLEVDDLFKDGASHIPIEALDPFIELGFEALVQGGASEEDLLKAAFGYFSKGGDIDFLLPDTPEFDAFWDKVGEWLPGLDFEKGGWGIGYDPDSNDIVINHDFPSYDFDLPEGTGLPELGNPCTTADGQAGTLIGGALEGTWICDPELPDFNIGDPCSDELGNEGFLNELGVCDVEIKIETPYDCETKGAGWTWNNLIGECIPPIDGPDLPKLGNPCTTDLGEEGIFAGALDGTIFCEPLPDLPDWNIGDPCSDELGNEGFLNELGVCDIEVDINGPDWNIGDPCSDELGNEGFLNELGVCDVEIKIPTPYDCSHKGAGWTWDNLVGECVQIDGPDIDGPDINIDGPDINIGDPCSDEEGNEGFLNEAGLCEVSLPSGPSGNTGDFTYQQQDQFAYTPFNVYQGAPREEHNYLQGQGLFK